MKEMSPILSFVILIDNTRIKPKKVHVLQDQNISFTCKSTGVPQWFFVNYVSPVRMISRDPVLSLTKVQTSNKGYYVCAGNTEEEYPWSGEKVKFWAQAHLNVRSKFYIPLDNIIPLFLHINNYTIY